MEKDIQTRKDQVIFETSDPREMIGKFTAKRVFKTWTEDYLDEDTGEVVSIERSEVLYDRGTYIDNETATRINFDIQAGEINSVEVTNQRRMAFEIPGTSLMPYKVVAKIGGKNHAIIVQAQSITKALEVSKDFIELQYTCGFYIAGVKMLDNIIILNNNLRNLEEIHDHDENSDGDDKEASIDGGKYYKVEAQVIISTSDEEDGSPEPIYSFLVKTKDVDAAKLVITKYITERVREKQERDGEERKIIDISLLSAAPYPCNVVVDNAFCLAYKEDL